MVNMAGNVKPFAGLGQLGETVHQWVVCSPWVPEEGKFKGEPIYSIRRL